MQTIPARPDVTPPVKKKRHVGLIILAVLGGLWVLGTISGAGETGTDYVDTPTTVTSDTTYEVSADFVVDTMSGQQLRSFCTNYALIGSDSAAYTAFAEGYGSTQDPDAREVFDELVSRC
jgi:hypothetical protein